MQGHKDKSTEFLLKVWSFPSFYIIVIYVLLRTVIFVWFYLEQIIQMVFKISQISLVFFIVILKLSLIYYTWHFRIFIPGLYQGLKKKAFQNFHLVLQFFFFICYKLVQQLSGVKKQDEDLCLDPCHNNIYNNTYANISFWVRLQ